MFQFGKYPMDILEMLSGHQAHQFKGLGLERQLQHQQQVQLQHQQQLQQQQQQQGEASGALLSGLGLGSLQGSRSNAFSDSSSIFAKMSAPPPPIPQQTQSSSSQSSRKSSKMSSSTSGSGTSSSGYPQFLRPFHPAEAALAQEQLHSGMGRFDFAGGSSSGGTGVIGGVVTSAPPPPPLHPGLSVPQPSPGPSSSSPSPSSSTTTSNNPSSSSSTVAGLVGAQSDARSLHQQFSCMLAANQYFLSGVPANASLEQFLVQQGPHNHLGLADSNTGLAPPPALHPSHTHSHPTPQPQQQQQQLAPHALSHPHSHAHPHHPLHPAPQPSPLGGFDFQGIPVLSSNQLASLMQQEAGLPLPLPLHLSVPKDDGKGDGGSGAGGSGGSGSRRKKAMAGYLPQRKTEGGSGSNATCHNSSGAHSHDGSSGLVGGGGGVGMRGLGGDPSSILSSSAPPSSSSSTVSSSSSSASSSNSASVLVSNVSQLSKSDNQSAMTPTVTQPESESLYSCGECGKSFPHIHSLRRHIRSHEGEVNGPNSSATTNPNTAHQHQSDTGLPHSTQDGIPQQNAHHQHDQSQQQSNPDPSSSSCPSPDKSYCCNECGKGFKKRGHLLQHGVIHSGARPYACSTCERSFNRRESLTRHEKIHEDKPYRCPACGRCFRESTSLLNHAASGSCDKPGRRSRSSDGSSSVSSEGKVEGDFQGLGDEKALGYPKTEESGAGMSCDDLYQQERGGNPNPDGIKTEGKYNSPYSRDLYQTSYRVDDYRRPQGNPAPYAGDGSCSNSMTGPALRKAPLAPTLHPHPPNQQQHHHHQPQPHLPLSSLLDDSEDEVTSSAMSAIAAAAAASVLPAEMNSGGAREERRDIIGGLLGGLGFGNMSGPSSTSAGNGTNEECLNGSMMPLSHPAQQQPNSQNATPNAKTKRPRKPRQKREPRPGGILGEGVKRRRSSQNGSRGEGERPYLCTVCGRGFGRRETLRRHERVHTGEKPFHCDVCGKDFREPFHLTKHQTVHSGEKNFKCSLCGKDFGYAQSLKRHEKLHLRGDFKPRRSKTKSSANRAAVSQDNSQTTTTTTTTTTTPGSYYSYPQDKAQGSSASTSNQPPPRLYTCEICWKSFRHHFHLTAHHQAIHEHGGEKLFSCEVCGKAFAYSNSLTRHRLSQHGLSRAGPPTQPAGSGSSGNASSITESEAATNALLHLTSDNGAHNVQQTHSTISHTQHLHPQPAGFSPLFYTPEPNSHDSNASAPSHSQHSHYSHSTVGPLSHQPPLTGKGQQIYSGVTGNPIHSAPPHIHLSSSSLPQHHHHHHQQQQQPQQQQQHHHHHHHHSFQMPPQHLQNPVVQMQDVQKKKKKKKKKIRLVSGGQLVREFTDFESAQRRRFLKRKKRRLQHQRKMKKWIAHLRWAKYMGGIGINVGGGTWRVGQLKFRGLRSLIVPLSSFPCPICPSTTFMRRITLSVHRVTRHPPRKHGCRARLRCVVCGKRSRRLLSALRHRARHLSQGSFSCPRCPSRFWNGTLLQRHIFACRRVGGGRKTSPKGTQYQKGEDPFARSVGIGMYRH